MKVTRPLAFKIQSSLAVILGLIEIGQLERAIACIKALSKLIDEQTVTTIETRPSEDLKA